MGILDETIETSPAPAPIKQYFAEMIGMTIYVTIGLGGNAMVMLAGKDCPFCVPVGWGIGVAVGILSCFRISGAHLNPAVSFSFCLFKMMPWRKLPFYVGAQLMGAFIGACICYGSYYQDIQAFDIATASAFASYPHVRSTWFNALLNELLGSCILLIAVVAILDPRNGQIQANKFHIAGFVGATVLSLALCYGVNAGCSINPARDFAPRFFTALAGWGPQVFSVYDYYFWVPIIIPLIGGPLGMAIQTLVYR